jgi:hypothetical protein
MRSFLSGANRVERQDASGAMLPAGPGSDQVAAIRASDYGIAAAGRESGIFLASFMQTVVKAAARGRAGRDFIET